MAREFSAPPLWVLLIPAGLLLLAWAYARRRTDPLAPIQVTAKRLPVRPGGPSMTEPTQLPPLSSKAGGRRWITPTHGAKYEPLFLAASARYGIPAGLLSRQAQRESNYNPNARSGAGALGIMQIIPRWHPALDPGDAAADAAAAFDPARAIPYAAKYLRALYDRFGSWTLALAAYNAGPTVVAKYGLDAQGNRIASGGVPPFTETRNYVAAILPDVGISQPETGVRYA